MTDSALESPCEGKRILIDAELLVLFCVGSQDPTKIRLTAATKAFTENDFAGLILHLGRAKELLLTQAVLAEASNHLDRKEQSRQALLMRLADMIRQQQDLVIESRSVGAHARFVVLGFADCALWECASRYRCCVLTKDFRLVGLLQSAGIDVVNFNHLRSAWL